MLSHIMIVADAFDAMTTNRIYRPRKSITEALKELEDASGTQFHPDIVDASMVALKDIDIAMTSQMPTSKLEEKRMSYFFQDSLTGLYNEDYLHILLNTNNHSYKSINVIDLKKFTQYNQAHGWEKGNQLLKDFAKYLKELLPQSTIIRYHGDDFIVLNTTPAKIDINLLAEHKLIKESGVKVHISYHVIDQFFNYEKFKISTDK